MTNQERKRQVLAQRPLIYLITDRKACLRTQQSPASETAPLLEAIRQAIAAGCQLIQIRERDLSATELHLLVLEVIELARPSGALVFVNDRVDVALAAKADGVHLRASSLKPGVVREHFGNKLLIGASVHSVDEVQHNEDADFVVLGPVFETQSKLQYGEPVGLEMLKRGVAATTIPVLGIGGINLGNFRSVLDCGAAGIAAIGLFTNAEVVAENVSTILSGCGEKRMQ